jgi:hypothetical protein
MSDENILINIDENSFSYNNDNDELTNLLKEINDCQFDAEWFSNLGVNSNSDLLANAIEYDLNYNVKQLLLICDYYGLLKEVKTNKLKKPEIISFLLDFEENVENAIIVYKRKQLWYFMSELKNDKFMKKFLLW